MRCACDRSDKPMLRRKSVAPMPFGARSGGRVPAGRHLRQWGLAALAIGVVADAGQAEEPGHEPGPLPVPMTAAPPSADAESHDGLLPGTVSGSVVLTSNAMSRGVTDSGNEPAIQGTLEYALETGLLGTSVYIGMAGGSVDIEGDRDTAHVEVDALFGIRGEIGDTEISWDLGGAYYSYPGTRNADNFDYWEIPLTIGYEITEWLEIEFFNAYAPEYQFNTGQGNYTNATLTCKLPSPLQEVAFEAFGGVGYQYIENDSSGTDWTAGITATVKGVDLTVAYTDTNYHARACGGNNQCDAKLVLSIGASF